MIGRIIWIGALAVIAVVATGSELDRQARLEPELADNVPGPFRMFALQRDAIESAGVNSPDIVLEQARKLVRRNPVPAESLGLLAVAQARAGESAATTQTIQLAAQRGWRDTTAQEGMLVLAAQNGNYTEAANRLAALLVLRSDPQRIGELMRTVLAAPQGRKAFATTLAAVGNAAPGFVQDGAAKLPDNLYAETLRQALAAGVQFGCQDIAIAIDLKTRAKGHPADPGLLAVLETAKARCTP